MHTWNLSANCAKVCGGGSWCFTVFDCMHIYVGDTMVAITASLLVTPRTQRYLIASKEALVARDALRLLISVVVPLPLLSKVMPPQYSCNGCSWSRCTNLVAVLPTKEVMALICSAVRVSVLWLIKSTAKLCISNETNNIGMTESKAIRLTHKAH